MIITQTPLRVSFFGGGTDIREFYSTCGGAVLSTTIDKYVYIIVKARYDDKIVLNYSEKEIVDAVPQIRHNIFRECLKLVGIEKGIEITSIADIPSQGSGLGSSSSFTVGLLNALHGFKGEPKNSLELAEEACGIEIDVLKEPIGKQDQYAAAFGGFKVYVFNNDGSVSVKPVSLSMDAQLLLQRSCHLYYTGMMRKASSVLGDQKDNIANTRDSLAALRDMALESATLFENNEIEKIGRLLHRNWLEKMKLSRKVSSQAIDGFYKSAMDAGAYGGKILGAGGGGFFLFMCPPEVHPHLRDALSPLKEYAFSFTRYGSRVVFSLNDMVSPIF